MKDTFDLSNLLWALVVFGHEVKHAIQFETMPELSSESVENELEIKKLYEEAFELKDKKLKKAIQRYYSDFLTLSKMERDADKAGFNSLLDILAILEADESQSADPDLRYVNFLSMCQDFVISFKRDRNLVYTKTFKDYYNVKNELAEFNVKTSLH